MWLLLGLFSAATDAGKNVLAKHNTKSFNSIVVTWAWVTYSLFILIPVMFIKGIPQLDMVFWQTFVVRIILDFVSLLMYIEAIKRTDLSLSMPMLALSPLFLLVSGYFLNGEFPSNLALIGVLLIVVGTYFLNFKGRHLPWYEPITCVVQDRGTTLMLGASIIWGITGSLHKLAILHSNPYFYTGLGALTLAVLYTPLAWFASREDFKKSFSREYLPKLVPVGLLDGLTVLSQFVGQSMSLTVLVISLKRTSIIFSSILGWWLFGEKIGKRIVPICMMVAGVVLIAVGG
jgi:drug/metabolite transporter (DMT)-like permease